MSEAVVSIAPLFRSEHQLRLLGALFTVNAPERTVSELARVIDAHQATVSREVARLEDHGVVVTRVDGRNRYVSANWSLSWASDLQALLTKTIGLIGLLGERLSSVDGVERAVVYGSWAARYHGEPGSAPRDIDVLVLGRASDRSVRRVCREVSNVVLTDVQAVIMERDRFERPDPDDGFVATVQSRPFVEIPLVQSGDGRAI